MNDWDHLSNAAHINCVLASLEANPGAWDAAWGAARDAAWGAVAALIAWDDCEVYLRTPPEAFPLLLSTTNHAAVLLHPAAIVFSKDAPCPD